MERTNARFVTGSVPRLRWSVGATRRLQKPRLTPNERDRGSIPSFRVVLAPSTMPSELRRPRRLSTLTNSVAFSRIGEKLIVWRAPTSIRRYGSSRPVPNVASSYWGLPDTSRWVVSTSCQFQTTDPVTGAGDLSAVIDPDARNIVFLPSWYPAARKRFWLGANDGRYDRSRDSRETPSIE